MSIDVDLIVGQIKHSKQAKFSKPHSKLEPEIELNETFYPHLSTKQASYRHSKFT